MLREPSRIAVVAAAAGPTAAGERSDKSKLATTGEHQRGQCHGLQYGQAGCSRYRSESQAVRASRRPDGEPVAYSLATLQLPGCVR